MQRETQTSERAAQTFEMLVGRITLVERASIFFNIQNIISSIISSKLSNNGAYNSKKIKSMF